MILPLLRAKFQNDGATTNGLKTQFYIIVIEDELQMHILYCNSHLCIIQNQLPIIFQYTT